MIHERNNSITLDEQIAQIRADINDGKQSFPIDIVDTIGNDSQLYYERADGYQEKYVYDGDGSIIGYWDSTMEVKQVGDLNFLEELKHYFEVTPREQVLKDWNESAPLDQVGPTVETIIEDHTGNSIGDGTKYKEPMVYLVDMKDVDEDNNIRYAECSNAFFKAEAINQNLVMTILDFVTLLNESRIEMRTKYIRIL